MIVLAQIVYRSQIKAGLALAVDGVRGLVKDFASDGQLIGDLALYGPADVPDVSIAVAGVDPVADASKRGPVVTAFLNPQRQEDAGVAGAQILTRITRRKIDRRIDCGLRSPASRVFV